MTDDDALEVTVPELLAGERVDRAVSFLGGVSRRVAAELVESGSVSAGGKVVRQGATRLVAGQVLGITGLVRAGEGMPRPEPDVPLDVVHQDIDLVVVDKPAGQVVHPGSGNSSGTLVGAVLARYPDVAGLVDSGRCDPNRPGIVHRLDRQTSGLLVVARSPRAYESLVGQFSARTVDRRYVGAVLGTLEADRGVVDAPIGRSERDPTAMAVMSGGRPARTGYRVVERLESATLLELVLETGRTHQIRVHLAAIGHPVIGDTRYGGARAGSVGCDSNRIFLHAERLGFRHPADGSPLLQQSPLPRALTAVLEGWRTGS